MWFAEAENVVSIIEKCIYQLHKLTEKKRKDSPVAWDGRPERRLAPPPKTPPQILPTASGGSSGHCHQWPTGLPQPMLLLSFCFPSFSSFSLSFSLRGVCVPHQILPPATSVSSDPAMDGLVPGPPHRLLSSTPHLYVMACPSAPRCTCCPCGGRSGLEDGGSGASMLIRPLGAHVPHLQVGGGWIS